MDLPIELELERTGDLAVVALPPPPPGDEATVHALGAALAAHLHSAGPRVLILDCSQVEYACSAFLGQLLKLRRTAQAQGRDVVLCGLHSELAEIFRLTAIGRVFRIYPDRAAALAAHQGGPGL